MKVTFSVFRLNLITIALTLLLIVSSIASYFFSIEMQNSYDEKEELAFNGNRFMAASSYLTNEVRAYAATGDKVHFENFWNEVKVLQNRDKSLARMKEIGITDSELAIITEMSKLSNNLIPLEASAMDDVIADDLESAITYVYGPDYKNEVAKINALKESFLTRLDERTSAELASLTLKSNIMQISICIYTILIISMQIMNYGENKTLFWEIDVFSKLYNRNKYISTIEHIIKNKEDTVGIVYVDINGLKQVNDEYGNEYGDKLILSVVSMLNTCFSENVFRIGGDEFAVLYLNGSRTIFDDKLMQLRRIVNIQSLASVSIGSTWCSNYSEISNQIAHAAELMHVDKQKYYMNRKVSRKNYRATIAHELYQDILAEKFFVVLQPKVQLTDGKIIGAEALVRKKDGKNGILFPDKFLPIYETDGIIPLLDFHVLETVCKMLNKWKAEGNPIPHISVNFSRFTILEYKVAQKINDICQLFGVDTKFITIELTEHISNISFENLDEILKDIKSFGFGISLDDFGREYANLSIIRHIAFDEVKLDKSLIDGLASNPAISTAIRCIVEMCNAFRPTSMVVEGIESLEQVVILREINCDLAIGQGYYFSRPISSDDFMQYFAKGYGDI